MSLNPEVQEYLENVQAVVYATNFERHCLWEKNRPHSWVGALHGYGQSLEDKTFIGLYTVLVQGRKILFIDATSTKVNWNTIDIWVKTHLPDAKTTDAQNFHAVLM